ncbi:VOC family protein [Phytohabitans rumicis]|uniref:Glyoxalase n=1 Tax=Phytohabitans rumicis TaxID=1076125 RepID=A0A6V8LJE6_9ACTN|nr:VOC family protein [Phytohabitans rumicis]GFJ95670.1 glyoxalase [Phytohabitans rumicis]
MVTEDPAAADRQAVVPMISYADGPAAMDWLTAAFGFVERLRWLDDDGRLSHGEMLAGDGLIMLATPTPEYEGPKAHREHCAQARAWSSVPWVVDGMLVYIDDVDAHCARARAAGATILSEPEGGYPGRRYRVEDLEGHRWMFTERAAPA